MDGEAFGGAREVTGTGSVSGFSDVPFSRSRSVFLTDSLPGGPAGFPAGGLEGRYMPVHRHEQISEKKYVQICSF